MVKKNIKDDRLTLRISKENKKSILNFCNKYNISLTNLTLLSLQNFFDENLVYIDLLLPKKYNIIIDNIVNKINEYEYNRVINNER